MSASPQFSVPKELMQVLHKELQSDPARTQGIKATYAFVISGANGGSWWIQANDGVGSVHDGSPARADVTVQMPDEVLMRIGRGELHGAEAFVTGQLKAEGDLSKAPFLAQIFGD